MRPTGPEIGKSALVIVDMQNDFVHPEGGFSHLARERPEAKIDMPFLMSTIPHVKRLADAFRRAGRPVVYVTQVLRSDYSDAAFPYWRATKGSTSGNRTFIVEGTWGAQIVDELKPEHGDHLVVKKGFGGFANTPLDTILRNLGVNTCVMAGVTTCVCVSTTIREGVEYNYRMIIVTERVRRHGTGGPAPPSRCATAAHGGPGAGKCFGSAFARGPRACAILSESQIIRYNELRGDTESASKHQDGQHKH